jgi:predicted dehydrogenase
VTAGSSPLGVVLQYQPSTVGATPISASSSNGHTHRTRPTTARPVVNVIGAGSFAQRILIPRLKRAGFTLGTVASAKGLSAKSAADQFAFARASTVAEAIEDPKADMVAIATRHSSHAALAEAAMRSGKAVFVEKPPCLTQDELDALRVARAESGQPLLVGFNRRYAPLAIKLREHVRAAGAPIELLYRINAGPLPSDHWLNDPDDGGGRLLGEGCHFIDFACWVVGALPVEVSCVLQRNTDDHVAAAQSFASVLGFEDGSLATIMYSAAGSPRMGKEYVEAHAGGRSGILDDYRELTMQGPNGRTRIRGRGDKGHNAQFSALRQLSSMAGSARTEPDQLGTMESTLRALRLGLVA